MRGILKNRIVQKINVSREKVMRAAELEPSIEVGLLTCQRTLWNHLALDEFASFPIGTLDDKVDAIADV